MSVLSGTQDANLRENVMKVNLMDNSRHETALPEGSVTALTVVGPYSTDNRTDAMGCRVL